MNVGELKELLAGYSDDTVILVSQDEEGNGFNLLHDLEEHMYVPGSGWIDQVWMTNERLDAELNSGKATYYSEEDRAPSSAVLALVLWP